MLWQSKLLQLFSTGFQTKRWKKMFTVVVSAHNKKDDPLILDHRCTNTCVSWVNVDKSSSKGKKGTGKGSHTLNVFFFSVSFFIVLPKCKAGWQPWMKNNKRGWKETEKKEKLTLTRVTHLLVSFCLVFIQTAGGGAAPPCCCLGSQVERGEMGGEFPPHSSTVLTAAYWWDVASLLKHDSAAALEAGVCSSRADAATVRQR